MSISCGIPFLNHCLAIEYLDMSAFYLIAACDIYLGYLYRCHCVFNEKHAALCNCACRCYLAVLIECEGRIGSYCIALGSYCLTESICNACLKTGYLMSISCGIPFLNYIAFCIEYLDMCAFELSAVSYIHLGYLYRCLCVLNKENTVCCYRAGRCYLTCLADRECRVCSYGIAVRSYCLTESVCNACLKTGYLMSLCAGSPALDYPAVCIEYLYGCACNFLAVCDIYLGYLDRCLSVLNKDNALFCYSAGSCHLAGLAYRESCLCCYCVAVRSYSLTESVLSTCCKACYLMSLCAGSPALDYLAVCVEYLYGCACNFLAVCDIYLGDAYRKLLNIALLSVADLNGVCIHLFKVAVLRILGEGFLVVLGVLVDDYLSALNSCLLILSCLRIVCISCSSAVNYLKVHL